MDFPEEYLLPDFDPNELTVPKLKAALSAVGVELPMKQERKPFYVDLFIKHITKKANTLRKTRQNVYPSSEGIMAVSGRGSPRWEDASPTPSIHLYHIVSSVDGSNAANVPRQ